MLWELLKASCDGCRYRVGSYSGGVEVEVREKGPRQDMTHPNIQAIEGGKGTVMYEGKLEQVDSQLYILSL